LQPGWLLQCCTDELWGEGGDYKWVLSLPSSALHRFIKHCLLLTATVAPSLLCAGPSWRGAELGVSASRPPAGHLWCRQDRADVGPQHKPARHDIQREPQAMLPCCIAPNCFAGPCWCHDQPCIMSDVLTLPGKVRQYTIHGVLQSTEMFLSIVPTSAG
jgi:hypothetical protein